MNINKYENQTSFNIALFIKWRKLPTLETRN